MVCYENIYTNACRLRKKAICLVVCVCLGTFIAPGIVHAESSCGTFQEKDGYTQYGKGLADSIKVAKSDAVTDCRRDGDLGGHAFNQALEEYIDNKASCAKRGTSTYSCLLGMTSADEPCKIKTCKGYRTDPVTSNVIVTDCDTGAVIDRLNPSSWIDDFFVLFVLGGTSSKTTKFYATAEGVLDSTYTCDLMPIHRPVGGGR